MRYDCLQRCPTVCSNAGPTAQRQYDAHHHHRSQHTLQRCSPSPTPLRPVPARAHHLQPRVSPTARLPCVHVIGSPQHHLPQPSALRSSHPTTAPILSVVPLSNTPAPPVDNDSARASRCMR
ncbi:hypothetical protein B0H14DRAFT_3453749 [Mycena olivaceomarginata]|nr:hypothetical protein B0H14DRAFT_3453749 [Mycena olivaceomarginata]